MSKFPPPPGFVAPPPPGKFVPPPAPAPAGKFMPPPSSTSAPGFKAPPMNSTNNNNTNSTPGKFVPPTTPAPFNHNNNTKAPAPFNNNKLPPGPTTGTTTTTSKFPAPVPAPGKFPMPAPSMNNNNTAGGPGFQPAMMNNNNNTATPPPAPAPFNNNNNKQPPGASFPAPPTKAPAKLPFPAPNNNNNNMTTPAPFNPTNNNTSKFPAPALSFPPPPNNNNSNNMNNGGSKFPPPPGTNNSTPIATGGGGGFPAPPPSKGNFPPPPNNSKFPPPPSNGSKFPPPPNPNNNNNYGNNYQQPTNNNTHNNFVPPPNNNNNSFNNNNQMQMQQNQNQQQFNNNNNINRQQQTPPITSPNSREEVAISHTMILEKSTAKNTRLMRHNSIPRTSTSTEQANAIRNVVPSTVVSSNRPYHSRYNVRSGKAVETQAVQCTSNVMPGSPQVAEKFGIPIGISVRPLAPIYRNDYCSPEEENSPNNRNSRLAPPLVHFQEIDPSITMIRCAQCRSYINPFVSFTSPDRYICSVCRRSNAVPVAYQCEVDRQTGLRTDISQRHELLQGCCDIVAPQEYVQGAPKRPTMLFLIDVSYQAATSGFLAKVCEGIKRGICEKKYLSDDYQVAFVAYDSNVYLFNLSPELESPKMIAAPDLVLDTLSFNERGEIASTLELPCLLEDLLCGPVESCDLIDQLMTKLPQMFANSNSAEAAFGPALNTAMSILAAPGGKVFSFVGSCPGAGEGKLDATTTTKRGAPVNAAETPTNTLPANDFYKTRAVACSAHQISVDLFVSAANEVDLATIAPISRYTSGHITRVHNHMLYSLPENVAECLGREYGFDAVLRIRAPSNVALKNFYGHFHVKGPDLLSLPVSDTDSVYSFELCPTNVINHTPVFVQIAFMYTTRSRERRIRVFTFGMDTSSDLAKLYNHCSAPLCASFYSKMLVDQCISTSFQKSIQHIVEKIGKTLKAFRTIVHGMSRTPNQLSLPHSLMGLPLLLAGVFRSAAVRPLTFAGNNPASSSSLLAPELKSNDERVAVGSMLVFSTIDYFLACVMPSCWCVWDPNVAIVGNNNQHKMALDDITGEPVLPRSDMCSVESFRSDSIYLVDCGEKVFLWVGKNVASEVAQSFGLSLLNVNNNNNNTNLFPEAKICAQACNEFIQNRLESLEKDVQTGSKWGSIITLFQDPNIKIDFEYSNPEIAFGGLPFFTQATERSMYPFLIEDDMQDAASYGSLLMNLAKKAGEP